MARANHYYPFDTQEAATLQRLIGSGGGGGSLAALSDVTFGAVMPLATSQILLSNKVGDDTTWFNIDLTAVAPGIVAAYLAGLPGFAPGAVLTVNAGGDGVEWVGP